MGMDIDDFCAGGYLPASFLDWEGHVSAVIFVSGCNFRCPWCHNRDLVLGTAPDLPMGDILADIRRRAKFLDGVVVSGGEPCMWPGIKPLLMALKETGLPVKLDTNGSLPDVLFELLAEKLVDFVAMDVKAPFDAAALKKVAGVDVSPDDIRKSVSLIRSHTPGYEFRTTYVSGLLTKEDLLSVRESLDDDSHWVVQCFRPVNCLDDSYLNHAADSAESVKEMLPGISVRG